MAFQPGLASFPDESRSLLFPSLSSPGCDGPTACGEAQEGLPIVLAAVSGHLTQGGGEAAGPDVPRPLGDGLLDSSAFRKDSFDGGEQGDSGVGESGAIESHSLQQFAHIFPTM